jgi:hypothetical protein
MMQHLREPLVHDNPFTADVVDGASGFSALSVEWQTLFETVEEASWLCDPQAFRIWERQLRPKGGTLIIAVRDQSGHLRGIMPLMRDLAWRGPAAAPRYDYDPQDRNLIVKRRVRPIPVRQVTVVGSLPATMLWVSPLCRSEDKGSVQLAVIGAISRLSGWDVTVLPAMEGEEELGWRDAFAAHGLNAKVQRLGRVAQDLHNLAPFQEVVDRQKKKFRQNVRRAQAAAEEAGVRFEIQTGAAAIASHYTTIAELARASWKHEGRENTDVHLAYDGAQQAYFEAFFAAPDLKSTPVLGVASDAEGPIVVFLMLRHGSSVTALLTFWNGRQPQSSPGLLLLGKAIDWAAGEGLSRFDFNATAPWVRYIADTQRSFCHIIAFAPNLRGRALAVLSGLAQRLR